MSLEISFFVSSILSAYWNGAATYYRGLARALHQRGHRLRFFEPQAFGRHKHRDIDALPWGDVTVYEPNDRQQVQRCLRAAASSDYVVKAGGVGVGDEMLEAEVAALGSGETRTIFWDVDTPATLARLEDNGADPLCALLRDYDLVLCYGGGDAVRSRYTELGARRCEVVYNALDPTTHFPVAPDERFAGDLGFLGNRLPDREQRVQEFLFGPARRLSKRRFVLGGSGWDDTAGELPNLRYVGHVYTTDHNAFNVSAMAVINISRNDMAETGFSPATRLFEAAGSGACLISDAWDGIELFLEPGQEVLIAENADDVACFLEELTPDRAREIGRRARERLLAEHTYEHRARQLEGLLNGGGGPGGMGR
jgi:spore maturation protein CgeB